MASLIQDVKLSSAGVVVGEPLGVEVLSASPTADITVNNVPARGPHYVQFDAPGTWTIVATATLGKQIEQVARQVKVRPRDTAAGTLPYPIIKAVADRYQPRTVAFSIDGAARGVRYDWDFGDGGTASTQSGTVLHDYTDALGPDAITQAFTVGVTANYPDGTRTQARRTIGMLCVYAQNKLLHGLLTPRVTVLEPITIPLFHLLLCAFTVQNIEDEDIVFTEEKHEVLDTAQASRLIIRDLPPGQHARQAVAALAQVAERIPAHHPAAQVVRNPVSAAQSAPPDSIRIPARSSVTLLRVFSREMFAKTAFGVAVHLRGTGQCSKRQALSSAYIEARLPMEWSSSVGNVRLSKALDQARRRVLTHAEVRELVSQQLAAATTPPPPEAQRPPTSQKPRPLPGTVALVETGIVPVLGQRLQDVDVNFLFPDTIPFDLDTIKVGDECDPDNVPDNLPEGMVCQLTSETAWRYVPGRVLNAKKGDVILSPGGSGLIGMLLKQVTPPQYYSHSGVMTKNHIQIRHSTASADWLLAHPNGILGQPTDGFEPGALKYQWPGTITQSMDEAFYYQWLTSPDKGPFKIEAFSFDPETGNGNAIVYPLVVKPSPFADTASVRATLHAVADQALAINGHYRFYCYTDPAIALDPANTAGADAGWANGTLPTVCSSFVWLSAQKAGVRLEGPDPTPPASDLEPGDVVRGAEVDAQTRDGLYHYTADERQAAARWLYQNIHDQVENKAGFLGKLLTDAPDDVANQVCNTFASDWADTDSKDSDAWQHTGDANAVSPDNLLLWDSPEAGNQRGFRSIYGHNEELFYRPGTYVQVPIYRWKKVATRGSLTGVVIANGDVSGATVSLQGSALNDVTVGADGRFRFDNVPSGSYTLSAGVNINHYWNSKEMPVEILAGQTTDVTVVLDMPPETNRLVTISVDMVTDWKSVWAHGPYPYFATRSVKLHPFHSHEHVEFEGSHDTHGKIMFDIDLNPDLSINVSWTAQEIDDEVEGEVKGGRTVAKDGVLHWSGLRVVNDDPIDADWTDMSFTVTNALSNA